MDLETLKTLAVKTPSKIVLVVLDGLGGLAEPETGMTELEAAATPVMDGLAAEGICGLIDPVDMGITPGSGPGHLALFGYDPLRFRLGRGVLEAAGIEFDLRESDVAARGNFATIDEKGTLTDRRAGRLSTEESARRCALIDGTEIEGVRVIVRPVREHRFIAVFRGEGLLSNVGDTDPSREGVGAIEAVARDQAAEKTARIVNKFVANARKTLASHPPANMVLLRGFSSRPHLTPMQDLYRLTPAAHAVYPMYRGLARLSGMEVPSSPTTIAEEFESLGDSWEKYDFHFLHIKNTDSAGEDGNFLRKVAAIEAVDGFLAGVRRLDPDVLIITGDHSTPARLKGHSWHSVPFLLASPSCRRDKAESFSEAACLRGGLGRFRAVETIPLALAHARKLGKFGA